MARSQTVKGFRRYQTAADLNGNEPNDGDMGPLEVIGSNGLGLSDATAANQTTEIARLSSRFGGGKSAAVATVTASGDTTILTPTAGMALTVYWISAINDPDETTTPLVKVKIGSTEIYRAYAVAHWEPFTGAVNASLVINLDGAASVAVTAHYTQA